MQCRGTYGQRYLTDRVSIPQEDMIHSLMDAVCIEAAMKLSDVGKIHKSLTSSMGIGTYDNKGEDLPNIDRILGSEIIDLWFKSKHVNAMIYAIKRSWSKELFRFSYCDGFEIGEYIKPRFKEASQRIEYEKLTTSQSK